MSQPSQQSSRSPQGQLGLPGWAWGVMGALVVVAVVAVVVAVLALGRGPGDGPDPTASPTAQSSPSSPPPSSSSSPTPSGPAQAGADGCLGGASELDQAVVQAQQEAPLTADGAATFTASMMRWAFAGPPPPFQAHTGKKILDPHATKAARSELSSSRDLKGSTGTIDFAGGKYYVEVFEGTRAIVSYLGTGHLSDNGVAQPDVLLAGTAHLHAVNGTWRLEDSGTDRSVADMQRIGTPYVGGC